MYDNGLGVTQDHAQAVAWYEKAAEQGDAIAQYNLGLMYVRGQGIRKNYVEAHKWWSLAEAKGDRSAGKNRQVVEKLMTPEQLAEAQRRASEWRTVRR
jgi:TPR repeat protein